MMLAPSGSLDIHRNGDSMAVNNRYAWTAKRLLTILTGVLFTRHLIFAPSTRLDRHYSGAIKWGLMNDREFRQRIADLLAKQRGVKRQDSKRKPLSIRAEA